MKYVLVYTEAPVRADYDLDHPTPLTVGAIRDIAEADVVIVCGRDGSRVLKARDHDPSQDSVTEIATQRRSTIR